MSNPSAISDIESIGSGSKYKKYEYKFLSDAQLLAEIARCEACELKPCMQACPANCSPMDFIFSAKYVIQLH